MFCEKCGTENSDQSLFCTKCGSPLQSNNNSNNLNNPNYINYPVHPNNSGYPNAVNSTPPPKKKSKVPGCLIAFIVVFAIVSVILVIIFGSIFSSDTPSDNTTAPSTSEQTQDTESTVIYEDNYIKASFVKVYSDPIVDASVEGVVYLQLLVENKSDKTITVALTNSAVNGMSTTFGSGLPMEILPGNSSQQPFIIYTNNTNVKTASDINKLQFSFYLFDDNYDQIEETEIITVNVK